MLPLLLDLGWKSALIAGLGLLARHGLRHRAPGERVALLRATLAALWMLPLVTVVLPPIELAVLPAQAPVLVPSPMVSGDRAALAIHGPMTMAFDGLSALYWTGVALLSLHFLLGLMTLGLWTRHAVPVRDGRWLQAMRTAPLRRPVRLLVSPRIVAPLSWGLYPAWILINPVIERCAGRAEAIVAHELAHVRRFDWPVLMAARLATFCFWFNPLVWLLARTLARETELAADEDAIRHVDRADYAQALLSLAGPAAHPAACGMSITHSALGRRIRTIIDADGVRAMNRAFCAAMLIGCPLVAAPFAAMQFVPSTPLIAAVPVAALETPPVTTKIPAAAPASVRATRSVAKLVKPHRAAPVSPVAAPPPAVTVNPERAFALEMGQAEAHRHPLDLRQIHAAQPEAAGEPSDQAIALRAAARKIRRQAEALELIAAAPETMGDVRRAHVRTASDLRHEATLLDDEARRMKRQI